MSNERPRRKIRAADLALLTDEELLGLRFCDLPVRLSGTEVYERVQKLYEELRDHGIRFKPHVWLSDEWFCADGIPGIAIPFYLAHPRLIKLEQKQMLEAEGSGERECLKILRHEAGHALDNAYLLHSRKTWQKLFGLFREPYPKLYRPRPGSKRHVLHLNNWYAQAHPAEDFAETFAVWMTPGSRWRHHYSSWPVLKKLEYVDELMGTIGRTPPVVNNRAKYQPLPLLTRTLRRHYELRKSHYGRLLVDFYTRDLQRLFSNEEKFSNRTTAASFIRQKRRELRGVVAHWTGTDQYTVDQVLEGMTERSKQLKLRLTRSETQTQRDLTILVTAITMSVIHSGRNRVAL